ncbi:molybdopterin converting factor subunit 1 [Lentibacillus saliphilus]|uniref:molybdopterin converting factor subunit 1 n=1 Tax=Lentibacillus saliphilus TaxID=2737028 RepID=UPI001C2F52B5|nr:molybdopterin converting factor subunit 1 [Lentibacillus saliphilus]
MVNVLFFAGLQEAVGEHRVTLDVAGKTIDELKTLIKDTYSLGHLDHVMVAVNEEYVGENIILNEQDTVAFIPPVSGG